MVSDPAFWVKDMKVCVCDHATVCVSQVCVCVCGVCVSEREKVRGERERQTDRRV